jgi:hypothetical protein
MHAGEELCDATNIFARMMQRGVRGSLALQRLPERQHASATEIMMTNRSKRMGRWTKIGRVTEYVESPPRGRGLE